MGIGKPPMPRLPRISELPSGLGRILVVALAAGVAVSPSIVLAPTLEGRTITLGIIERAMVSDGSGRRVEPLALGLSLVLVTGWIVAVFLTDRRRRGDFASLRMGGDLDEPRGGP
jgi:hypothetical protein